MNEAAREAETRRPGICHHEAAHAVFAYHSGEPIAHVMVGEDSESLSRFRYMRGDLASTARLVAGLLAGKYAEELATTGQPREHVPFERFDALIREYLRHPEKPPEGVEDDDILAHLYLTLSMRADREKAYNRACEFTAEHVERWWNEIDAVANGLLERGHLDGGEVARIIEATREDEDGLL
jgi:hypothetical protein